MVNKPFIHLWRKDAKDGYSIEAFTYTRHTIYSFPSLRQTAWGGGVRVSRLTDLTDGLQAIAYKHA